MTRLISIDLKADMGFLKKPDINEGMYLTFNLLHKPGLLGILGAILGLAGYQKKGELPEYYRRLSPLRIGIQPLGAERGNFSKAVVQYNNSVGYASQEKGGNLIIVEQTLLKPAYRCFLLLDDGDDLQGRLLRSLRNNEAEFIPYLGKNEHAAWWENYLEHGHRPVTDGAEIKMASVFMKAGEIIKNLLMRQPVQPFSGQRREPEFVTFEELPVAFDERLMQYRRERFVFTNIKLTPGKTMTNLYHLDDRDEVIQLF